MPGHSSVRIRATGAFLPQRTVSSVELAKNVGVDAAWVHENLGIIERRLCEPGQLTSDLAAAAGQAALRSAGLEPNDIDGVIVCTSTPDSAAPATACLVKHKLGINNFALAFDVVAACAGFVCGVTVAESLLLGKPRHRRFLVIGADTFSKITDWQHQDCFFFGDGAGAVILEKTPGPGGLLGCNLYAENSATDGFSVPPGKATFEMNRRAVYDNALGVLPEAILGALSEHGYGLDELRWIIPHQPSIRLLRKLAERLHIDERKVKMNMQRCANTAGASIPILLDEVNRAGELAGGDLVMLVGIGAGWSWGTVLLRWA
jgi:3-oxoacyl-[acyl-carrier-protein] synthase III